MTRPPSDPDPHSLEARLLTLEGSLNFRDLGGYPTTDGRTIHWGKVYRADGLHELTAADHEILTDLGLGLVCDFRSDDEVERDPNLLPEGVEYLRLPVQDESMQPKRIRERVEIGDIEGMDENFMAHGYIQLLENRGSQFAEVFERLVREDAPVTVYHCSAGKDRTGVMSALLLLSLGVPESIVVNDYTMTEQATRRRMEWVRLQVRLRGGDPAHMRALMGARPEVIQKAIDHLNESYGGADGYVTTKLGLSNDALGALRDRLVS